MSDHVVEQVAERSAQADAPIVTEKTGVYPPIDARSKDGTESQSAPPDTKDIEHVPVRDDPRYWSRIRKVSSTHFRRG